MDDSYHVSWTSSWAQNILFQNILVHFL
jgi:hypothetical protein